jgi:hypothetical protein
MMRRVLVGAVVCALACAAPCAHAQVKVSAHVARQMAHDFLGWEKRKGYTTAYRVTYCRGHLTRADAGRFPTWGVRAFCRTHRRLSHGNGQMWDLFTVYDERLDRRCRLWGGTYFAIDDDGRPVIPEHYTYRPCPIEARLLSDPPSS